MSLEAGGRADKGGNRYENRFLAKLWIDLIRERLTSIEVEPLGDKGRGVEFITTTADGKREYYQCKSSNGIENYWRPSDLGAYSVFQIAKTHIQSGSNCIYHFVSPLSYDELDSLCDRTRTASDLDNFLSFQLTNDKLRNWWNKCKLYFCEDDVHTLFILSRCHFDQIPDNHERIYELETLIELLFVKDNSGTPASIRIELEAFANDEKRWGRPINAGEVLAYLEEHGFQQRLLVHDERTLTQIKTLNQAYVESFHPIGSSLFHRCEAEKIMECIHNGMSALILGEAGSGKSGCIHEVIERLETEGITHLVLPLDKRQPTGFADYYGRSLGLLCSPCCVYIASQADAHVF